MIDGIEKEVDQTTEEKIPGYLEAVYHLYSMQLKHGPLIIRMRTANRTDGARLPSLTPSKVTVIFWAFVTDLFRL